MKISDFSDERIHEVRSGLAPLTAEEREFLVSDTPTFEECGHSEAELSELNDADLMSTATACGLTTHQVNDFQSPTMPAIAISPSSDLTKFTDEELMAAWREQNSIAAIAKEAADKYMEELNRRAYSEARMTGSN